MTVVEDSKVPVWNKTTQKWEVTDGLMRDMLRYYNHLINVTTNK